MPTDKMVKPTDHSSGTESADRHINPYHARNDSHGSSVASPLAKKDQCSDGRPDVLTSRRDAPVPRPLSRRRQSTTSNKTRSRPAYSRKYSTPPSRPLSPAGFPRHLELDMAIPELDLSSSLVKPVASVAKYHLDVDTAPQNPDIWSDPETDYFSTIEGPNSKHIRGKSRRLASQNMSNVGSLQAFMATNAASSGLQRVKGNQEIDFFLPPTPGGFAG